MKRGGIPWLVSSALLLSATAAIALPLPCASVSAEVREYVRNRGACSDAIAAPRPRSPKQSKSSASSSPTSAQQNEPIPDVVGRSVTDAARALAKFKVERIETASAAPAGEVLAQEPAPSAAGRTGGTVILRVSDGSLAVATSTNPVEEPATAAAASAAATPVTAAVPSSAPAPASSAAPLPPQEPIDSRGASGQFSSAFSPSAALIFGVGGLLGLVFGALLMRQRLLRGQRTGGENMPPTLPPRQQPVDQRPAESGTCGLSEPGASSESGFAARLAPAATTIVLAPLPDADEISTEHSSDYHVCEQVRLHAPIEVSGDDVERALFEQSKEESAVARAFGRLRGASAERVADELNRVLDIDILDLLAQGWVQVPAMHRAVQLSALTRGPPELVSVARHNIASTSRIVVDTRAAGSSLLSLDLALEIVVEVQSATLAARNGRIELVALGEATVLARIKYKSVLVKEHATEISGTPRDPSEALPPESQRLASVDFPV